MRRRKSKCISSRPIIRQQGLASQRCRLPFPHWSTPFSRQPAREFAIFPSVPWISNRGSVFASDEDAINAHGHPSALLDFASRIVAIGFERSSKLAENGGEASAGKSQSPHKNISQRDLHGPRTGKWANSRLGVATELRGVASTPSEDSPHAYGH